MRDGIIIILFVNMKMCDRNNENTQGLPLAHRWLTVNGIKLHVVEVGSGAPILFLHGFPDAWYVWRCLFPELASRYRMVAPDLRGYNLSEKPPAVADYQIEKLIEDVRGLIVAIGGKCTVVGHDWGGMLAWCFAALHPTLIHKLVVLNAPHPLLFARQLRDMTSQRATSSYLARLAAEGAEFRLTTNNFEVLRNVVAQSKSVLCDDELNEYITAWSQPEAMRGMVNWYRALALPEDLSRVDSIPDLGGANGVVDVPTLVVWGDCDGSFSTECLSDLDQWVKQLTLRRVAEGGHWLLREQPARVARCIDEFLSEGTLDECD